MGNPASPVVNRQQPEALTRLRGGSLLLGFVGGISILFGLAACQKRVSSQGFAKPDVYIWQRTWNSQVTSAVISAAEDFRSFLPMVDEIGWHDGSPTVLQVPIDFAALKSSHGAVGAVLRIDGYSGPFQSNDLVAQKICRVAKGISGDFQSHGLTLTELQVDFDCPESKLAGYRTWVRAIRETIAPIPLHITALPSWLKRTEFGPLAREAGGFILQVHSVEKPADPNTPTPLCDPRKAAEWAELAAHTGVPFRVALPTYSCLVAFDASGKLIGLSAEAPLAIWPKDVRLEMLRSDPIALADLVRKWEGDHPAELTGLIWYRLPIANDQMNWRMVTLMKVASGTEPTRKVSIRASGEQPTDLVLENSGEMDEPLPARIDLTWQSAKLISSDALRGFSLQNRTGTSISLQREPGYDRMRLPPGEQRNIGWLLFDQPTEVHADYSID